MALFDFSIFYNAAQALLAGNSPYSVFGFYNPMPLALAFIPFALLPEPLAYVLFLAISVFLLWKAAKSQFFWALLSFTVLFTLFVGQLDLLIALSTSLLGPYAIPLILMKPQLAFVLLPWLVRNSKIKAWLIGGLITIGMLAVCFLLRPNWVSEWLASLPAIGDYSRRDSNLYWLISPQVKEILIWGVSPAALAAAVLLWKNRRTSWTALHLFAPVSNIYSPSILVEWIGPLEAALSWVAIFAVGGNIHSGAPMFLVGLSILFRHSTFGYKAKLFILDRIRLLKQQL